MFRPVRRSSRSNRASCQARSERPIVMRIAGTRSGRFGTAEVHARFGRRPPALSTVAVHAARDDILPVLPAPEGDRDDMVERQLARGKPRRSMAGMVVARVDVRARERHVVESALDLDVAQKPDDRGQLERERD